MLPRRCKKCSCYIAPHLAACPRCGKASPIPKPVVPPTKEEKQAERDKRDAKVPVVHGMKMHWVPSKLSIQSQRAMVEELKRRIAKEESARARNAIRSELRLVRAHLARATVPDGKHAWTTEALYTKVGSFTVYISPKKHRYVLAERDDPADLIIETRKSARKKGVPPFLRLQRLEKSGYARALKKAEHDEAVDSKRQKTKKAHRAKKRKRTRQ